MKRVVAIWVAFSLATTAGDFAILNLRVVEGEGMVYPTGGRATRGITVEVTDETGKPVPDVSVSIHMPEEGPSGVFTTGSRTEVVTTRQDGRATVWGMKWNRTPGVVQLRITAMKNGVRAGIVSVQHLSDTPVTVRDHASHGNRLLLIGLAVAAAAGTGLALGMARGTKTAASASTAVPLSIGTPSVIVGAP